MNLLPEWAPNVHPLLVHFPIALIVVSVLFDAAALALRKKYPGIRHAAVALYALGAVAAVIAFFSGRAAADGLELQASVTAAVTSHSDWAAWTAWALGLYGLLRLGLSLAKVGGRWEAHAALFLLGSTGLYLVQQTAERGARLVYELGVGVRAQVAATGVGASAGDHEAGENGARTAMPGLDLTGDGGWRWSAESGALPDRLVFLQGARSDLGAVARENGLLLRPGSVFFTIGEAIPGVEMRAVLDLSEFKGRVALAHHVLDVGNYDFLRVESDSDGTHLLQGRIRDGLVQTFDTAAMGTSVLEAGPVTLRAIAYGTHFRGYFDGELITHGHGEATPPGPGGLVFDGSGVVRLLSLAAIPVTE